MTPDADTPSAVQSAQATKIRIEALRRLLGEALALAKTVGVHPFDCELLELAISEDDEGSSLVETAWNFLDSTAGGFSVDLDDVRSLLADALETLAVAGFLPPEPAEEGC